MTLTTGTDQTLDREVLLQIFETAPGSGPSTTRPRR